MISVVVCTYNRAQVFKKMIQSFFEQDEINNIEYEIIVIDNNSNDNTYAVVAGFIRFPELRYIFEEKQGLSIARNRGIEESKGEIVAFLDDDVIVDRKWLRNLDKCIAETTADIIGGRSYLIFEKDPPIWLGPNFRISLSMVDFGNERLFLSRGEGLFGLNLTFRKSVLKSVGCFDPKLGRNGTQLIGGEEFAVIQKIASLKGKIVYDPDVVVGHIISSERLEWDYFKKNAIGYGKSKARLESSGNPFYRLLRIGNALLIYLNSLIKLLDINLTDKDPYEKKLQESRVMVNKGYLISRMGQLFVKP